ncbi:MAG TPA: hypothetical protein VKP67_28265 [Xanthobacteraceae bacterium]|nr:hypothetical protein [Xanthobacteraceae bacterium]
MVAIGANSLAVAPFPSKPLRIVVPVAPVGSVDLPEEDLPDGLRLAKVQNVEPCGGGKDDIETRWDGGVADRLDERSARS